MIADDLWTQGLREIVVSDRPHIFRVPFLVCPRLIYDGAMGGHGLEFAPDPLLRKIAPQTAEGYLDASWARPPYPEMIIMSERRESGVLHVLSMDRKDIEIREWPDGVVRQAVLTLAMLGADGKFLALPFVCHELEDHLLAPALITQDEFLNLSSLPGRSLRADVVKGGQRGDWPEFLRDAGWQMAAAYVATCALLNCRNIRTEAVEPGPSLQRSRQRRGQLPLFSYHVLKVFPFKELGRERGAKGAGAALPIHWIRGHFKTFSEARPLFGRLSGRFWWQPCLHGRDHSRRVEKSYAIQRSVG